VNIQKDLLVSRSRVVAQIKSLVTVRLNPIQETSLRLLLNFFQTKVLARSMSFSLNWEKLTTQLSSLKSTLLKTYLVR
jgi:hypothetical protein